MNTHSLVVSATGFEVSSEDPNNSLADLITMIQFLNMRFASTLSEETNVLIVKTTLTEKYKIAKIYSKPIICVRVDWLIDSYTKNDILPTQSYEIKDIFFGVEIVLVEINPQKLERVKDRLEQNGATVDVIELTREYLETAAQRKYRLVLTEEENLKKLSGVFAEVDHPIVGLDWFEDSMKKEMCKFPEDYSLNYYFLRKKAIDRHIPRMNMKLSYCLAKPVEPNKKNRGMLDSLLVYFHYKIPAELRQCLKHLVTINGGYYLEELSLALTHVLVDVIDEEELYSLKDIGITTQFVRVEWLIDSIYLNRRISEEDYLIRSYRPKQSLKVVLKKDSSYSLSFETNSNKNSISLVSTISLESKKNRRKSKIFCHLFKGYFFYLESSHRKDAQYLNLTQEIENNGGKVFISRNNINSGSCFYVLKDCHKRDALVNNLKQATKNKVKILSVSHRWVKQCISKVDIIGLKGDSYIYQPFPFPTPINGFHKMVFLVIGLDAVTKLRLKELYNTLGSVRNTPNRSEITHCLCGADTEEINKFLAMFDTNTVVFLNYKWLLECMKAGNLVPYENYLIQGDHIIRNVSLTVNDSRDVHLQGDIDESNVSE